MTVKLGASDPDARRARRQAAEAYGAHLRRRTAEQRAQDQILVEAGNDIALRDTQW